MGPRQRYTHGGVLILHSAPESAGATLGVLNHEHE